MIYWNIVDWVSVWIIEQKYQQVENIFNIWALA